MNSGHPPAAALAVTARQRALLSSYHNKHKISERDKLRIGIILGASEGRANKTLARHLGVSPGVVLTWRSRWADAYEDLLSYEQGLAGEGVSDSALLSKMLALLQDAPRSGRPARISDSQKDQLVALACEKPQDYGVAMSAWNRQMLAQVAMDRGIVEQISARYVSEILKK